MASSVESENFYIKPSLSRKGKGLYARHDFVKDEVILEEQPLVSAQFMWNQSCKYLACDHCLRSLETAQEMYQRLSSNSQLQLPHPECCEVNKNNYVQCNDCQVVYCSEGCRQLARQHYHSTLCMGQHRNDPEHPVNKLIDIWKSMHYPPETSSIMLILRMIAIIRQAVDRSAMLKVLDEFCRSPVSEEEGFAHKLLGAEYQDQIELLRRQLAQTLYDDSLQQWYTPEGFRSLLALIGMNSQGIGSSSFSVWVKNTEHLSLTDADKQVLDNFIDTAYDEMDTASGDFLDCEGSGLYAVQSCCNHSCSPTAQITFPYNNHTLVMRALTNIKANDEILISYLGECDQERSRHSRQKLLKENYLFSCCCEKCMSEVDQPDATSEEEEESMDETD